MLIAFALLYCTSVAPSQAGAADLLQRAIDLPTPMERALEAKALAAREDLTLDDWLEAAAAFAPREETDVSHRGAGSHSLEVDLVNLGVRERTHVSLYVPAAYDRAAPAPLIVGLHGTGGSGRTEVDHWRRMADALGAVVLAPSEFGENTGFRAEQRERQSIREAIRWARREFNVDETRIWVGGYSRGGHLTWDLVLRTPGFFAGAIPIAGGPMFGTRQPMNNLRFVAHLGAIPVRSSVGELEQPALLRNLLMMGEVAAKEGWDHVVLDFVPGTGHGVPHIGSSRDWSGWGELAVRDPWPDSITLMATTDERLSSAWLSIDGLDETVEVDFDPVVKSRSRKPLSQEAMQAAIFKMSRDKTARVDARWKKNLFTIKSRGATSVTVRLTDAQVPKSGKMRIRVNGKNVRRPVVRSKEVLLRHFVEHFDRGELPVASVSSR